MPAQREEHLSRLFRALGDTTRREVLAALADGELTPGELLPEFDMSQPALSQHLAVLRDAGLVTTRKEGRHTHYSLDPSALLPAKRWIEDVDAFWEQRLDRLGQYLRSKKK